MVDLHSIYIRKNGNFYREIHGKRATNGALLNKDEGTKPTNGDTMEYTLWWTNIAMENHHFSWENPL